MNAFDQIPLERVRAESTMRRVGAAFGAFDLRRSSTFDGDVGRIMAQCRGWSSISHYWFFRSVMDALPEARGWLVLGVYQGRDIALIQSAAAQHPDRPALEITGVDLFSPEPCADWPEDARGKTWEQAGFGPAPTLERANDNLAALGYDRGVTLVKSDDARFLELCRERGAQFDVIYIDTAHDFATVERQIRQCRPLLAKGGLMCGDDYAANPQWGVIEAVKAAFPVHGHIQGAAIWFADPAD